MVVHLNPRYPESIPIWILQLNKTFENPDLVDLTENRNLTAPDHQLAATLKEFSQQARELEAELRFEEALVSREKIVELTELRFWPGFLAGEKCPDRHGVCAPGRWFR